MFKLIKKTFLSLKLDILRKVSLSNLPGRYIGRNCLYVVRIFASIIRSRILCTLSCRDSLGMLQNWSWSSHWCLRQCSTMSFCESHGESFRAYTSARRGMSQYFDSHSNRFTQERRTSAESTEHTYRIGDLCCPNSFLRNPPCCPAAAPFCTTSEDSHFSGQCKT